MPEGVEGAAREPLGTSPFSKSSEAALSKKLGRTWTLGLPQLSEEGKSTAKKIAAVAAVALVAAAVVGAAWPAALPVALLVGIAAVAVLVTAASVATVAEKKVEKGNDLSSIGKHCIQEAMKKLSQTSISEEDWNLIAVAVHHAALWPAAEESQPLIDKLQKVASKNEKAKELLDSYKSAITEEISRVVSMLEGMKTGQTIPQQVVTRAFLHALISPQQASEDLFVQLKRFDSKGDYFADELLTALDLSVAEIRKQRKFTPEEKELIRLYDKVFSGGRD